MVHVSVSSSEVGADDASASDTDPDLVDRIIAEYEPLVAVQRRATAHIWLDRSISKANMHVLMLLGGHGPLPMSRLAGLLDVSLPNATGIVDRMEEHGLVERIRDEHDRRVVLVRATTAGVTLVDEIEDLRRSELRRILERLDHDEQRTCLAAFRAMRRAAERPVEPLVRASDPSATFERRS
jgi:DNA-binding MarR family transcriptional regulator